MAKNGPNNEFLESKMVLDLVFDGFSCISMVCIMQNSKIPGSYPISRFLGHFVLDFYSFT